MADSLVQLYVIYANETNVPSINETVRYSREEPSTSCRPVFIGKTLIGRTEVEVQLTSKGSQAMGRQYVAQHIQPLPKDCTCMIYFLYFINLDNELI